MMCNVPSSEYISTQPSAEVTESWRQTRNDNLLSSNITSIELQGFVSCAFSTQDNNARPLELICYWIAANLDVVEFSTCLEKTLQSPVEFNGLKGSVVPFNTDPYPEFLNRTN